MRVGGSKKPQNTLVPYVIYKCSLSYSTLKWIEILLSYYKEKFQPPCLDQRNRVTNQRNNDSFHQKNVGTIKMILLQGNEAEVCVQQEIIQIPHQSVAPCTLPITVQYLCSVNKNIPISQYVHISIKWWFRPNLMIKIGIKCFNEF